MIEDILATTIRGLALGSVLVLLAQGLNIIWGVLDVVNIAHGEFIMIGAFIAYILVKIIGLNFYLAPIIAFFIMGAFGVFIYFLTVKRIMERAELMFQSLVALFGVSIILINVARILGGGNYYTISPPPGVIDLGYGLSISYGVLIMFLTSVVVTLFTFLFLKKTRIGIAIRAVSQSKETAKIVGINIHTIFAIAIFLGIALSGIGGALLTTKFPIYHEIGISFTMLCFALVVMGGLGSFRGVLFACLFTGLLQSFVGTFIGFYWRELIPFILLLFAVTVRFR